MSQTKKETGFSHSERSFIGTWCSRFLSKRAVTSKRWSFSRVTRGLRKLTLDTIAYNESVLQENPNDASAHAKIGQALLPLGRYAIGCLFTAWFIICTLALKPGLDVSTDATE